MSDYHIPFNTGHRFAIGQSDDGEIILKDGEPAEFDRLFIDLLIMVDALESIKNN